MLNTLGVSPMGIVNCQKEQHEVEGQHHPGEELENCQGPAPENRLPAKKGGGEVLIHQHNLGQSQSGC